jgi:ArsR family transcriptional regulator
LIYYGGVSSPSVRTAKIFGALADPTRFSILLQLRSGERRVGELCKEAQLGQSLMSFHLKALRDAGLLRSRRQGRTIWYSIDPAGIARLRRLVESVDAGERASGDAAREADLELCWRYINVR